MMKTLTTTEARKNIYKLIDQANETHEPIQITGKNHNAVLVGEEDWRNIQETMYLISIPGMRESILKGMTTPLSDCTLVSYSWKIIMSWSIPSKPRRTLRK